MNEEEQQATLELWKTWEKIGKWMRDLKFASTQEYMSILYDTVRQVIDEMQKELDS